jgi:alkanesulfonate monooxygenase SsuD/methylene tetrahydromethanopterin reductase-like flavin-dependent oxidoreductase (luciferase family)
MDGCQRECAMLFGAWTVPTEYSMNVAELGRELEARGFESLFLAEHTHIPVSRRTPTPSDEPLRQAYWHSLDPFVALTAVASATKRLTVGTGVCLVAQRDPIITAKAVSTLDLLSGGRVIFGIGGGWNREEMEDHGGDVARRRGVRHGECRCPDRFRNAPLHVVTSTLPIVHTRPRDVPRVDGASAHSGRVPRKSARG